MNIGVPKEVKDHEYRIGMTPDAVSLFVGEGHNVFVERDAGTKIGFTNELYEKAGAKIVATAQEVYKCEMVIKVKEPQKSEFDLLKKGQLLFCFLHLAPDPVQTEALLKKGVLGLAYETITDDKGKLPLLIPMSEMAGRVSIQAGANALHMSNGGRGTLLGGIPGVAPGKVVVLGGGIVGTEAMRMAIGLGADVTIFDHNLNRLRELDQRFAPKIKTLYSTPTVVQKEIEDADLVVGAVLIPGKKAPKLVTREMLKTMQPGSVIVDVAIDQGGCIESSRPTTHSEPTFIEEGVVHYCVTNMPAACARTSTLGLTNATMPYALHVANVGIKQAILNDPHLKMGLNVCLGKVTNKEVATDLDYQYVKPEDALADFSDEEIYVQ